VGTREEQIYDAGGKMKKNKNKTPTKYMSPLICPQHPLLPLAEQLASSVAKIWFHACQLCKNQH